MKITTVGIDLAKNVFQAVGNRQLWVRIPTN
jgi:hypothetical protein